jgi:branched-chain amino acid transport system permease protein
MTLPRIGGLSRPEAVGVAVVLALALLAPLIFSDFFVSALLTQALWLGLVAMSLVFLSSYGGMVSLAQVGIFGVAGVTYANLVEADGGVAAATDPWLAALAAIVVAVCVALIFGAIAARSEGIYFLMITLAFGVMVYYFVSQVTEVSGHGGVNNVDLPGFVGDRVNDPERLYYFALAVAIVAFLAVRYLGRTPFGLTLQGIRDEPTRMRALGFNVELHRTLAFGVGGLIAAVAGVLFVWYNRQIGPGSVALAAVIDVLIVAVIGGLYRLQGAWVGALAFVLLDNYSRDWTPEIGSVLGPERFNTLLGIIFLIIVLVSPGGLVGAYEQARDRIRAAMRSRETPGEGEGRAAPTTPASADGPESMSQRKLGTEANPATTDQ